jgi:hypothetical protein
MDDRKQARINELAETIGLEGTEIRDLIMNEDYWVVDDVNKILYTSKNNQFAYEAHLVDLFTLLHIPVGDKYTIFLSSDMVFLVVLNSMCCDTEKKWQ